MSWHPFVVWLSVASKADKMASSQPWSWHYGITIKVFTVLAFIVSLHTRMSSCLVDLETINPALLDRMDPAFMMNNLNDMGGEVEGQKTDQCTSHEKGVRREN